MRKNYLVAAAVFLGSAVTSYAQNARIQESQPVDVAVMFNAEQAQYSYGNNFWMYGGSGELAVKLKYNISLVVNETGMTAQGDSGRNSFSRTITTAGPRYTLPFGHTRSRIFAEGLFGGVHGFNSVFPSTNGALTSANSFGMQIGGGYDLRLNRTWSFRVVDIHYIRTNLPNGFSNRQQDLLLGTGIVWRPIDRSAK